MEYVLPIGFAVATWWLSTVVIVYRAGLPRQSFLATLLGTSLIALLGAYAILASRHELTPTNAYLAFIGALAIWGWHEVSYLFGFISGPKPEACPPNVHGWRRFVLGVKTCVYHEMAVLATVAVLAALTWNSPNTIGLLTFVILWLMRWSAKLNIFLGVRNLHEEFWPEHLNYLKSFVGRRSSNELFPVSIVFSTAGLALLAMVAVQAGEDVALRTGYTLLATLLALAVLEHLFLVARVKDDVLWRPAMRSRGGGGSAAG
ncbi:MAG: putative photosynthetic complex assembly protein PuhE [Pseudomonadota bacterium]